MGSEEETEVLEESLFSDICDLDVTPQGVNVEKKWKDMVHFANDSYENTVAVSVRVEEKRRMMLVGNTNVTYTIQISIGDSGYGHVCVRSYNEFVIFRRFIVNRFLGCVVPPLPARFGHFVYVSDYMIEKRATYLELFLESIARHTFLRKDILFINFIQSKEPITKVFMESLLRDHMSEGLHRWKEMIRLCRTPKNPFKLLTTVQREVNMLLTFYVNLVQAIKAYMLKLSASAAATNNFGEVFKQWKFLESTQTSIQGVVIDEKNETNAPLIGMIKQMEEAYLSMAKLQNSTAPKLKEILKRPIKYEIMLLNHWKQKLLKVKAILVKYGKAAKALRNAEAHAIKSAASGSSGESNGEESNMYPLKDNDINSVPAVRTARTTKREAQKEARQIICSTLIIEIQRFRFQRGKRGNRILRTLAELNMDFGKQTNNTWTSVADAIPRFELLTANADSYLLRSFEHAPEGMAGAPADIDERNPDAIRDDRGIDTNESEGVENDETDNEYDNQEYSFDDDINISSPPKYAQETNTEVKNSSDGEQDNHKPEQYGSDDGYEGRNSFESGNNIPGAIEMRKYRVIHDFSGEHENELCVSVGEELLMDPDDCSLENSEWLWLLSDSGGEGYVPATHVELVS